MEINQVRFSLAFFSVLKIEKPNPKNEIETKIVSIIKSRFSIIYFFWNLSMLIGISS